MNTENNWVGQKDDGEKPRMDLVPPEAVEAMALVFGFGAAKYGDRNWEGGMRWGRVFAAAMRHGWAWWRGEEFDPESGFPHTWHLHACTAMLVVYGARRVGEDDRPASPVKDDRQGELDV